MKLSDEQQKTVQQWIAAGDSVAEVQKKLSSELDIAMTYLDVRMLVDDLGAVPKDREVVPDAKPADATGEVDSGNVGEKDILGNTVAPGGVSVDVDRITKPGSVASGNVVFSDGVKSGWALDATGRLGLSGSDPAYSPSQEDLQAFQEQLSQELRKRGF
ncbi:MAG: hypothetical protein E4H02_11125 [Lentisphaerales bacterium]|jgi:hypothetical protein|nr:MAG: hypothetical protein E4H02_11125 [Lentisphaerales bacterium]